jgi:hypothetical protein
MENRFGRQPFGRTLTWEENIELHIRKTFFDMNYLRIGSNVVLILIMLKLGVLLPQN